MFQTKVVDLFEIKNFVFQHLFRITYILAGELNFYFHKNVFDK